MRNKEPGRDRREKIRLRVKTRCGFPSLTEERGTASISGPAFLWPPGWASKWAQDSAPERRIDLANTVVRRSNQQTLGCEVSKANSNLGEKKYINKQKRKPCMVFLFPSSQLTPQHTAEAQLSRQNVTYLSAPAFPSETLFFIQQHKRSWCFSKSGSRRKLVSKEQSS